MNQLVGGVYDGIDGFSSVVRACEACLLWLSRVRVWRALCKLCNFSNGTLFALFALSGPSDKRTGCKREWSER